MTDQPEFTDDELEVIKSALDLQADVYYDKGDEERMNTAVRALETVRNA